MRIFVFLALALVIAGCEVPTSPHVPPPAPSSSSTPVASLSEKLSPTPFEVPSLAWSKRSGASAWGSHLKSEIKASKLPTLSIEDAATVCPNYARLSGDFKVEFWAQLISKMAEFESGFKPETVYIECSSKKEAYGDSAVWIASRKQYCIPGHKLDGGIAISRGLLQMSLQSAQGYGCKLSQPSELNEPLKNISCAVKIMESRVSRDGAVSKKVGVKHRGGAAYWSVLRSSSKPYPVISSYTKSLNFCR